MTLEELAREFEKAPKKLMKSKANELLFAEDYPEGRMQFVCAAMNDESEQLQNTCKNLLELPEGAKHLVRALNNLQEIGHHGALCFAQAIYNTLENDWDDETRHLKFNQILDSVSSDLRTGIGWLSEKAAQMLDSERLSNDTRLQLWIHWCAAILRSSPDAAPLIEDIAPRRPQNLTKSNINALMDAFKNDQIPWDTRSASAYLLLGNQLISPTKAQDFVEEAYASFPLEALEGVEILAIAIESDASALAEYDVIQSKLAQVRQENLILKEMKADDFLRASTCVFQNLKNLPKSDLEIALSLTDSPKQERLIKTALIDDTRKADWIFIAKKNNLLKPLGTVFFNNIDLENPICIDFSSEIVSALLDNHNADAKKADLWMDAAQNNDLNTLKSEISWWSSFCEN